MSAAGAVLVHGAWHDGSCWAPLLGPLAEFGLPARAVDLPSDRPGSTLVDCSAAVVDAARRLGAGPESPVVLVGHSLAGLVVPLAAQELGPASVAAIVLVGAVVPWPGRSWVDRARAQPGAMVPGFDRGRQRQADGTMSLDPEEAAQGLYAGVAEESSPDVAARAVAGLRPQDWTLTLEPSPLEAWPPVRTVSVVCADDRVVDPVWSRGPGAIEGAERVELAGGHFPMLCRPAELAAVVAAAARP